MAHFRLAELGAVLLLSFGAACEGCRRGDGPPSAVAESSASVGLNEAFVPARGPSTATSDEDGRGRSTTTTIEPGPLAVDPGSLGMRLPAVDPTARGRQRLQRGKVALDEGDAKLALAHLRAAHEHAPSWPVAQFYLGVAEDRVGNTDVGLELLRGAMMQDLPQFFGVWRKQKLTAVTRNALERVEGEIAPAWAEALERGLEVMLWREATVVDAELPLLPAPELARAGVYLPDEARFLPAGPLLPGAVATRVWPERREVLLLAAKRSPGMPSSMYEVEVTAFDAITSAVRSKTVTLPMAYAGPEVVQVASNVAGSYLRAINDEATHPDAPRVSAWQRVSGDPPSGAVTPQLHVMAEGAWLAEPAGVDDFTVTPGGLALRWTGNTAKGRWHVTFESRCKWDTGDEPLLQQAYEVTLERGDRKTMVSRGRAPVSARLVQDDLLLQIDRRLHRLRPDDPRPNANNALPAGLVLTTPVVEKLCHAI